MTSGTTNHATAPAAAGDLDRLGRLHGTSKSSGGRNLLRAYEPFFAPLRDTAFELLEIGVGDGASLRLWADYFPRATIVGLDVRRLALGRLPDRCTLRHGSQSDLATLHDLVRAHRFRVIIDDGSHVSADQIFAFEHLFPWIEPGGVYVCDSPDDVRPDETIWTVDRFLMVAHGIVRGELPADLPPETRELYRLCLRKATSVSFARGVVMVAS